MAVAMPKKFLFDVETYHQFYESGKFPDNEHLELIEGDIVVMPPIGSAHAAIVTTLDDVFHENLRDVAFIRVQNPVKLGDLSEPQPDIVLVRRYEHRYRQSHPAADDVLLLVEVADTTFAYDRETKALLYSRYEIPEFWLINITEHCVEVYHEPSPNGYKSLRRFESGESIVPINFPDMTIPVDSIF